MPPFRIVEALHVAKDARSSLLTGFIACALDLLGFQGSEERLDDRIVVTITPARHTLGDVVGVQLGSKSMAGLLRSLI